MSLWNGGHSGWFDRAEGSTGGRRGCWRVKVRIVVLEGTLDAGWATGSAGSARSPGRGHREPWSGWGGQDACATVAGWSTAGQEGCLGLRGVGLVVVWLHTGDVTVEEETSTND